MQKITPEVGDEQFSAKTAGEKHLGGDDGNPVCYRTREETRDSLPARHSMVEVARLGSKPATGSLSPGRTRLHPCVPFCTILYLMSSRIVRGWKGIAAVTEQSWRAIRIVAKKPGSTLGEHVRRDPDTGRVWAFVTDLEGWLAKQSRVADEAHLDAGDDFDEPDDEHTNGRGPGLGAAYTSE